jgi:hypothetical protein
MAGALMPYGRVFLIHVMSVFPASVTAMQKNTANVRQKYGSRHGWKNSTVETICDSFYGRFL